MNPQDQQDTNTEAHMTRPPGGLFDVDLVRLALGDMLERAEPSATTVRERLILAALYHLLQPLPPAEYITSDTDSARGDTSGTPFHIVDDVPTLDGPRYGYTHRWKDVGVDLNRKPPVQLTGWGWTDPAGARAMAAQLLSAADRAERALAKQTERPAVVEQPPRDEQGRTPRERVAAGLPAYQLTDQQAADVAVASGWIEDTPEARAAYLTSDEESPGD